MSNLEFHLPEDLDDEVDFAGYHDIPRIHGRRTLLYEQFGDYQGEWMAFARSDEEYVLYRDWYGSCSGCDAFEAEFSGNRHSREHVETFCSNYRPFALIPVQTAINLVQAETFESVFPANYREDLPITQWTTECSLIVKLEEDLALKPDDAFATQNMETRRRIVERLGIGTFVRKVIAIEGKDRLVELTMPEDDARYLHLHDGSTEREYLLRVPPNMRDVREAKAWSFGLDNPKHYRPLIET